MCFETQNKLEAHLKSHQGDCDSDEEEDDGDLKNIDIEDSIEIGMYECDKCTDVFDSFHELEKHGKLHIESLDCELNVYQNVSESCIEIVVQPKLEPND